MEIKIGPARDDEDAPEVKVVDKRWWAREAGAAADDAEASRKPSYIEDLEARLRHQDELLQKARTQFKAAEQDFEEARVRLRREIAKDVDRARRDVLRGFLDVADNLERAIGAATTATRVEDLRTGVEMVRDQFLSALHSFGVTRLDPLGDPFDPAHHEAVSIVDTADPPSVDTIVGVVTHGYAIGDEILRAATVTVARATREPS